jgi:hypothetical protein
MKDRVEADPHSALMRENSRAVFALPQSLAWFDSYQLGIPFSAIGDR